MPAIPFTSVDFPAPLSPTRAVTLPAQASIPASLSTCTAPKLLFMLRRLSSGAPAPDSVGCVMASPWPTGLPEQWYVAEAVKHGLRDGLTRNGSDDQMIRRRRWPCRPP